MDASGAAADGSHAAGEQDQWKVTASHNAAAAANATGTVPGARWDSAAPQQPGMYLQIELPQPTTIVEVLVDATIPGAGRWAPAAGRGAPAPAAGRGGGRGDPPASAPVGCSLEASIDGTTLGAPLVQGSGEMPTTQMTFAPVQAKFIRITQTGSARNNEWWGVQQVRIFQAGEPAR